MHNTTSIYQLHKRRIIKRNPRFLESYRREGRYGQQSRLLRRIAEASVRDIVGAYTAEQMG